MSIFINIKISIFGVKVLSEMIRFLKYDNPNLHRGLSQFHLTLTTRQSPKNLVQTPLAFLL